MLESTLQTQYVPGSVLKGDVSGAAWTYLLPRLELDNTVCIGQPGLQTLKTLGSISREVVVLCTTAKEWISARENLASSPIENIQLLRIAVPDVLPFISRSIDLIFLATRQAKKKFYRDSAFNRELQRILKPEGLIYYETQRNPLHQSAAANSEENGSREWHSQGFHVSPPAGELQSAVPMGAAPMMQFFQSNQLERPLLTLNLLKRLRRSLRNGRKPQQKVRPQQTGRSSSNGLQKHRVPAVLRKAGHRIIARLQQAERRMKQNRVFGRYLERYGVLVSPHSSRHREESSSAMGSEARGISVIQNCRSAPPQYLCRIASDSGLDLSQFQYGLSADGEFQSRKTLFFLLREGETTPSYVAKLSRDSNFNDRVERERDALTQLADLEDGISRSVPQIAFFGYHHNLAVLGQTAINGRPFVEKTRGTIHCPYARSAVEWIGELGAATADFSTPSPDETAASLETLLDRFLGIYHLDNRRREFLAGRINLLRETSTTCPGVFLHGDPHSTNLMVTEKGGIAFVDWEASDPRGMPLWDLLFFLRAYCMLVKRVQNSADQLKAFDRHFLSKSSLNTLILESVESYCEKLDLPSDLLEPLFYTCWMHRALREALRISPQRLHRGHYFNLLKLCIDRHDAPMLRKLFSAGTTVKNRVAGLSAH